MSDLILYAKPSTARQPKSERFSGTLPTTVLAYFREFYLASHFPFQGPKVSSDPDDWRMILDWQAECGTLGSF